MTVKTKGTANVGKKKPTEKWVVDRIPRHAYNQWVERRASKANQKRVISEAGGPGKIICPDSEFEKR